MRERPMLFNGDMVRAALAGRKTQTRRAAKLPHNNPLGQWEPSTVGGYGARDRNGGLVPEHVCIGHTRTGEALICPFGLPADRLWVRETFSPIYSTTDGRMIEVDYRATYQHGHRMGDHLGVPKKWTPSIHMPRAACRLVLEITAVRVERLQAISDADAMAEGIEELSGRFTYNGGATECRTPGAAFRELWTSTGGDWDSNPLVWVVEFKRVEVSHG